MLGDVGGTPTPPPMSKRPSSRRWLDRHVHDEYVQRAQRDGYRSRAAYKLLEIQDKYHLLRPGYSIVDLGAAPGGWSQVAAACVGSSGRVVGLDLLPMEALPRVDFIQGDFRDPTPLAQLRAILGNTPVDLVLSDLSPNVSGMAAVDQPRAIYLCELTLELAQLVLKPNGNMVVKVFQGVGFDEYLLSLRMVFQRVFSHKPKASRPTSREVYVIAQRFVKPTLLV